MIQNHALPKGKIALIGLSVFIKIILCDLGEILSLSLFFAYEDIILDVLLYPVSPISVSLG